MIEFYEKEISSRQFVSSELSSSICSVPERVRPIAL